MNPLRLFLMGMSVGCVVATADDEVVSLESKDGKSIQATIVSTAEDSVHVKRADGKEFDIPFARLSDETIKRIKERSKPKDPNPPPLPPSADAGKPDGKAPDQGRGHLGVTIVDANDAEMNAAMKKARDTFSEFWEVASIDARRANPRLSKVFVKARFNDPGEPADRAEHLWLSQIEFDGKTITGIIQNEPDHLKSVAEADSVGFPLDRLSDWIYVKDHYAFGGTTVRVIRSRLSESERSAHDAGWGCRFDGPAPDAAEAGAAKPTPPEKPDAPAADDKPAAPEPGADPTTGAPAAPPASKP